MILREKESGMPFDPKDVAEERLAYIRVIKSDVAATLYPKMPPLGLDQVFALHAADGTLIAIADSRQGRDPPHCGKRCPLSCLMLGASGTFDQSPG
jgi:hypothetical protein